MNKLIILLNFIFAVNITFAQESRLDYCQNDSLDYLMVLNEFKTKSIESIDLKKIYRLSFNYQERPRTDLCSIKLYALFFDQLLASGLDIQFDIKNNTYSRNSTNLPADSPFVLKMKETNSKITLYLHYFFLFEEYKKRMKSKMDSNPNFYELEVGNLLKYGTLTHPAIVKEILSMKVSPSME